MFHFIYKLAVTLVIPIVCIVWEIKARKRKSKPYDTAAICSKWLAFWAIGFSAVTTGAMQVICPVYTEKILKLEMNETIIISELGAANIAMGLLALLGLWKKNLIKPATLTYGIYILGCTLLHISRLNGMGFGEVTSLIGDIWIIIVALLIALIHPLKKKAPKENQ